MPGILISGPAGAGKSQRARQVRAETPGPAVVIEFQEIYAMLLGLRRMDNGRYPPRLESDAFAMPMSEFLRRAAITAATARDITPIVSNSDGDSERRAALLGFMGPGSTEIVVDPGIEIVTERLSVNGTLDPDCASAIRRWYGHIPLGGFNR